MKSLTLCLLWIVCALLPAPLVRGAYYYAAADAGGGGGPITFAALEHLYSGANGSSYASDSFAPTGNRLLLCAVANSKASATADLPTLTGNGLTWVEVDTVTWNSDLNRMTVFRAMGASPSSGAVTADFGGVNQSGCHICVVEFDGVDTSGTNGSGAVVQSEVNSAVANTTATVTLAALTGTDNAVWMAAARRGATGYGGTPETDWTENNDATGTSPDHSFTDIYRIATTDNTPSTVAASDNWGAVAVEIKVAP